LQKKQPQGKNFVWKFKTVNIQDDMKQSDFKYFWYFYQMRTDILFSSHFLRVCFD
jgi:hypothetical protein